MQINETNYYSMIDDMCTDWDGEDMSDDEEPMIIPTCGQLRQIRDLIYSLKNEVDDLILESGGTLVIPL